MDGLERGAERSGKDRPDGWEVGNVIAELVGWTMGGVGCMRPLRTGDGGLHAMPEKGGEIWARCLGSALLELCVLDLT